MDPAPLGVEGVFTVDPAPLGVEGVFIHRLVRGRGGFNDRSYVAFVLQAVFHVC